MGAAALVLPALLVLACASRPPASPGGESTLPEQPGTIQKVGDFGYGIVPASDPGTRYAPDALPSEFQVDGLSVIFAGVVTTPPPNVRMWGTPLRLTSIRRAP